MAEAKEMSLDVGMAAVLSKTEYIFTLEEEQRSSSLKALYCFFFKLPTGVLENVVIQYGVLLLAVGQ